jgi:hypothetical protein
MVHWRTSFAASAHDRLWHFRTSGDVRVRKVDQVDIDELDIADGHTQNDEAIWEPCGILRREVNPLQSHRHPAPSRSPSAVRCSRPSSSPDIEPTSPNDRV